jgi:hypothetical protein
MKKGLQPFDCSPSRMLAEWTGLEPATPGVTGRYSNQLNYHSMWFGPRLGRHPNAVSTCQD